LKTRKNALKIEKYVAKYLDLKILFDSMI